MRFAPQTANLSKRSPWFGIDQLPWRSVGAIRFQRGSVIGEGSFGKVHVAMTESGELVAVKQVRRETFVFHTFHSRIFA